MLTRLLFIPFLFLVTFETPAQDSLSQIPEKYISKLASTATATKETISNASIHLLARLSEVEEQIKDEVAKRNVDKATEVFGDIKKRYDDLRKKIQEQKPGTIYIMSLDTLITAMRFIDQSQLVAGLKNGKGQVADAIVKLKDLQDEFSKAESIKTFINTRRRLIGEQLAEFGPFKHLAKFNKLAYYYSEKLTEIKTLFTDRKKIVRKLIGVAGKTPQFREFWTKHSVIASMFPMPIDPANDASLFNFAGLQTKSQVNSLVEQTIQTGGPAAQQQFAANLREAQQSLDQLRNEALKRIPSQGANSDDITPEGFRPNSQKTRSLLKRLEYSTTIQTQKANNFFPSMADIGLNVGYKPGDRSLIGVGAAYSLGLGHGWKHFKLSHEGLSLRSFIEWKLKGNIYLTGGYEQNYKAAFRRIAEIRALDRWQQSGLIGITKSIETKLRLFRKTKIQALWDFLSYKQKPQSQPVIFRIGYNL